MIKYFLGGIALIGCMTVIVAQAQTSPPPTPPMSTPTATQPAPILKLINFTADWCPNCQRLNPRMEDAMADISSGLIERIDLDLTKTRRTSELEKQATYGAALKTVTDHNVDYLWNWYGGFTGIAVIVAADTGEPISCLVGLISTDDIFTRLNNALDLAITRPAGARKPDGPDCPPPLR